MSGPTQTIDDAVLGKLVPINGLLTPQRRELLKHSKVIDLEWGQSISSDDEGVTPDHTFYLISGELELLKGEQLVDKVTADSDTARFALAPMRSTEVSARAVTPARVLRVDSSMLSTLLVLVSTEVPGSGRRPASQVDRSAGWIHRLLGSELFAMIPPANIQRIFQVMKAIPVKGGDVVIRQGQAGNFFYIVQDGRCEVTRQMTPEGAPVRLAELTQGDRFGEEALLSGQRRNATVTMLTAGTLLRIGKKDFAELIKAPLLSSVNYEQAKGLAERGAAWLDIRLYDEHRYDGIEGSINISLANLRERASELDRERTYIVYCNSGRRSAAAAFLLGERGYLAFVLDKGLHGRFSTPAVKAAGTASAAAPEHEVKLSQAEESLSRQLQDEAQELLSQAPAAQSPRAVGSRPKTADSGAVNANELLADIHSQVDAAVPQPAPTPAAKGRTEEVDAMQRAREAVNRAKQRIAEQKKKDP